MSAHVNEKRRAIGDGLLSRQIKAAGVPLESLTVLAPQHDPYRPDTPAGHRCGKWFAEQVHRLLPDGRPIHPRGFHYVLVSAPGGRIIRPDGKPYANTDANWRWLLENAIKAARWLQYIPFNRIIDERNEEPRDYTAGDTSQGFIPEHVEIRRGATLDLPYSARSLGPRLEYFGHDPDQPFRIVMIGEKSSLGDLLDPIAQRVQGVLLVGVGEISDTRIYQIAETAAEDGRPTVILYFSDFDPSGWQMPISVSRKLQALRDLEFPHLNIAGVYPVALSLDQVRDLNLPSTPLKPDEKRGPQWRAVTGREQTEIDALAALQPDVLREIAEEAVKPFYDDALADRQAEAVEDWRKTMREWLETSPAYTGAIKRIEEAYAVVERAVEHLDSIQRETAEQLRAELAAADLPESPQAAVTADLPEPPESIFSTDEDFTTASRKLIDRKAMRTGMERRSE